MWKEMIIDRARAMKTVVALIDLRPSEFFIIVSSSPGAIVEGQNASVTEVDDSVTVDISVGVVT